MNTYSAVTHRLTHGMISPGARDRDTDETLSSSSSQSSEDRKDGDNLVKRSNRI